MNKFKANLFITIGILFSFSLINSCKNPTDGLIVTVNGGISETTMGFQILNANPSSIDPSLTISKLKIVGKDADKVYNINGLKEIDFGMGIFQTILKPGTRFV